VEFAKCMCLIWKAGPKVGFNRTLEHFPPASSRTPGLALRDVRSTTSITEHQTDRYRRLLIKRTRLLESRDSCDNKQALRSAATAASNKDGCPRIITSPAHAHPCTPTRCLVADSGLRTSFQTSQIRSGRSWRWWTLDRRTRQRDKRPSYFCPPTPIRNDWRRQR
jgi:hypothetical protein